VSVVRLLDHHGRESLGPALADRDLLGPDEGEPAAGWRWLRGEGAQCGNRPGSVDLGRHEVGFAEEAGQIGVGWLGVQVPRRADLGNPALPEDRHLVR
jgi:hypothetical protein